MRLRMIETAGTEESHVATMNHGPINVKLPKIQDDPLFCPMNHGPINVKLPKIQDDPLFCPIDSVAGMGYSIVHNMTSNSRYDPMFRSSTWTPVHDLGSYTGSTDLSASYRAYGMQGTQWGIRGATFVNGFAMGAAAAPFIRMGALRMGVVQPAAIRGAFELEFANANPGLTATQKMILQRTGQVEAAWENLNPNQLRIMQAQSGLEHGIGVNAQGQYLVTRGYAPGELPPNLAGQVGLPDGFQWIAHTHPEMVPTMESMGYDLLKSQPGTEEMVIGGKQNFIVVRDPSGNPTVRVVSPPE